MENYAYVDGLGLKEVLQQDQPKWKQPEGPKSPKYYERLQLKKKVNNKKWLFYYLQNVGASYFII